MKPIDEMNPDELRRAVAEAKGIQYRVSDGKMDFICGDRICRDYANAGELIAQQPCLYDPGVYHEDALPYWSTCWSDAWYLAEEMKEVEFGIEYIGSTGLWLASFEVNDDGMRECISGETMPIAVCRAYIEWKLAGTNEI